MKLNGLYLHGKAILITLEEPLSLNDVTEKITDIYEKLPGNEFVEFGDATDILGPEFRDGRKVYSIFNESLTPSITIYGSNRPQREYELLIDRNVKPEHIKGLYNGLETFLK